MLSEKEKKLVQDPYFQVLRLIEDFDEDYVELKSKCTVHCWAIRRKGSDVFLFHKHDVKHEYHKQCDCSSIAMAIKNIKEHDEFQLAGRPMDD